MEDLLFKLVNPVFSLLFWLIISPDARPWLYTAWAFTLLVSITILMFLLADRSKD